MEASMQQLDSRAASVSLESYVRDRLAESDFFSGLSGGQVPPEHVREVFGQYCLWRDRFHRWFGVCVARSASFGDAQNAPLVLGKLIACLVEEVEGNHHELALSFLSALGVDDPAHIAMLPVTDAYTESFLHCYSAAGRTGDEALAALAGRELVVPSLNKIIVSALSMHYGVTSGLEFFRPHEGTGMEHFRVLWEALTQYTRVDARKLIEAARLEIWEHVTFWDDVYSIVLGTRQSLAS
jgi:hypothetical protein